MLNTVFSPLDYYLGFEILLTVLKPISVHDLNFWDPIFQNLEGLKVRLFRHDTVQNVESQREFHWLFEFLKSSILEHMVIVTNSLPLSHFSVLFLDHFFPHFKCVVHVGELPLVPISLPFAFFFDNFFQNPSKCFALFKLSHPNSFEKLFINESAMKILDFVLF